jgi:surfeit locus 1 family protein
MSRKVFFSLFFTSGTLFCGNAGFWQLRRKKWKEGLIETRSKYMNQEPYEVKLPLPTDEDLIFKPCKMTGKFDHSKEMLILRKYEDQNGYRVVTPFYIQDNAGFLVSRGWVPLSHKDIKSRPEPQGPVTITGVLREGEEASQYTPANSQRLKEWYFIELALMSQYCNLNNPESKNFLMQEMNWVREREIYEEEGLPELPIKTVKSDLLNWYVMPVTHASYATFWFSTSAICLFFNLLVILRH